MNIYPLPGFSEPFSSIIHLLAAGVFLVLSARLISQRHRQKTAVFSLTLFAFSCIFLLSMSGVYHLLSPESIGRAAFRRIDHAAIFILIAGTFTPVHALLFKGFLRWGILCIIWILSITAITLKTIFFHSIPEWLGLAMFLGMGWIGLFTGILLYRRYDLLFIRYILFGALSYTVGAILEFFHMPILIPGIIGPHELFHIAVITGIAFHWKFIYDIPTKIKHRNQPDTLPTP